jgi:transposase-like protein
VDLDTLSKEQRDAYWLQIQTEYETTGLSYRKLADKYGVSFHTLSKRAKREGWLAGKEDVKNSLKATVAAKLRQTTIDRQATCIANAIDAEMVTADNIINLALEAFQDPRQFYKYAIEEQTQRLERVMLKTATGKKTEKIIEAIQNEISSLRPTKTIDASNMSLEEINKAIKNAQSKKCLALAMNKDASKIIEEEEYFKKMKETMKPESTLNKIDKMIEELKNMKQTKEVVAQIEILQKLR